MISEPILVMAFNRPDHLKVLLTRLSQLKPTKLYVAIDGARESRPQEALKVQACKNLVSAIDWPCEIHTNYQESNLGCGLGVSTAISWFLDCEERGIILEDDIIPDPSFFSYCTEMLDRYEDDERVLAVSGCNFVPPEFQSDPSLPYRFSAVPHIWGWATWRRSWVGYDLDISNWRQRVSLKKLWSKVNHSVPGLVFWFSTFEILGRHEVDTWDGQLVLASMERNQMTVTSNVNLIKNIGFDEEATHTVVDRSELQPISSIKLPIADVPVVLDKKADNWTRTHHFQATWRGMLWQAYRFLKRRKGVSK